MTQQKLTVLEMKLRLEELEAWVAETAQYAGNFQQHLKHFGQTQSQRHNSLAQQVRSRGEAYMVELGKLRLPGDMRKDVESLRRTEERRQQEILGMLYSVQSQSESDLRRIERGCQKGAELREQVGKATTAMQLAADKLIEEAECSMVGLSEDTQSSFSGFADQVETLTSKIKCQVESIAARAKSQAAAIKANLSEATGLCKQLAAQQSQVKMTLIQHADVAAKSKTALGNLWQGAVKSYLDVPEAAKDASSSSSSSSSSFSSSSLGSPGLKSQIVTASDGSQADPAKSCPCEVER